MIEAKPTSSEAAQNNVNPPPYEVAAQNDVNPPPYEAEAQNNINPPPHREGALNRSNAPQGMKMKFTRAEKLFSAILYMIIAVSINQTIYKKDNENNKLIHKTDCQVISLNITENTVVRFEFSVVRASDNQTFYDLERCRRDDVICVDRKTVKYSVGNNLKCYYKEDNSKYFSWHDYERNIAAYIAMIIFFVLMSLACVDACMGDDR